MTPSPSSFDWLDYYRYAAGLVESPHPTEAELRSAASRAYYAAFNCARQWVERNHPNWEQLITERCRSQSVKEPTGSHNRLWWFLSRVCQGTYAAAECGFAARNKRRQADYDDHVPSLCHLAADCLDDSADVLKALGYRVE